MTTGHAPNCRFCATPLTHTFVDLGKTPLANSYLADVGADAPPEPVFDLHARVCPSCLLVQVDDSVPPDEIFSDYAYFSSYSDSWVAHARSYAEAMRKRFALGANSLVVEIASNDGYLLQHFVAAGVPVLGIEPAANVAAKAVAKGVPTDVAFFGEETARRLRAQGVAADLMAANNVLAHVPGILDFVTGFKVLLKPEAVATFEFPHVLNLVRDVQFDTIYHEHFSYLSLVAVEKVLAEAGLRAFDAERLATHGGSLRLFVAHRDSGHKESEALRSVRADEHGAMLDRIDGYQAFAPRVEEVRRQFLAFLAEARASGKTVAAYGAAAKGNTFLNYCGVGTDDIVCVFDRSAEKQGRFLPGSRLPIRAPGDITSVRPDYLVILPWNIAEEVKAKNAGIADWGGRFVTAIPTLEISAP
ncbi:MAG: methyltransferase domain-containing protein [Hyphomicrobiaceae bacterium]|nr:methyltransferase domain-containing protein [Hyphomicrobiaceae bacterium]